MSLPARAGEGRHHPRGVIERHHPRELLRGNRIDHRVGQRPRLGRLPGRGHAEGRVDQHHRRARAGRGPVREERARERQREQQHRRHPEREEQELAQALPARLLDPRAAQEAQVAERHARKTFAPQEVQDDRHRDGQRAEQERRR